MRFGHSLPRACLLAFAIYFCLDGWCQTPDLARPNAQPSPESVSDSLSRWEGLPVRSISIGGVSAARLAPLSGHLPQAEGTPLRGDDLRKSMRKLFATGLYETIELAGWRDGDGVSLAFRGTPRTFVGTVTVEGAKGNTINTQLERAGQLVPGARFTPSKLEQALEQMRTTLEQNGYHEPVITPTLTPHPEEQLVDIAFVVASGPQARVGKVELTGDAGMTAEEFRRHAHLKAGSHVDHETANRALAGVLKVYRSQQRLEAEIKLESEHYAAATKTADFRFSANRGPVVRVTVDGGNTSVNRLKRVIPIFEEGTVDEDLLMEGNRRLRDYFQSRGYFDVRVEHEQQTANAEQVVILYKVRLGQRRRVERVSVTGNHYFDSATLEEMLAVRAAGPLDRHGAYSQALVSADSAALQAVYQNNGFSKARIASEIGAGQAKATSNGAVAPLTVVYRIEEGQQQRVGAVRIEGNEHVDATKLTPQMNTVAGQLLSPQNLAGDRDTLMTDYLSRGFDQARVDVTQEPEQADPGKVDVVFRISEGQQIFVRKVLLTGLHFTRPDTVARAITLQPGDPLSEAALAETQRNLYDFALFSEIDTAIENPSGEESYKTVLLQAREARRWALTYGGGFEAQTGTPQNDCRGALASGVPCTPNGKTGVSPRVLLDLTRNNLFGREQSASIQGTYGLLEQKVSLLFQNPHFNGNRNFGLSMTGGYANSQDVTTYVAAKLEFGLRWTEHFLSPSSLFSKANTLIYEYDFRRVKVAESSLQVCPCQLTLLATATRVAGPGFTWIRDTRDSPLDARRGTYTSFQNFLSVKRLGAEAVFNRLDLSNSSFYSFDKGRYVLARNTRYGQERAFGTPSEELLPLPERLYAGGATSFRAFPINAAGPRDPETGYPIGGAGALINSTEMRLPPANLPWLGNTVSFVLFHDMGNVFTNAGDAWASALRIHQPNRDACKASLNNAPADPRDTPPGPVTSTGPQGGCSFNYFAHAPGLGLRYHTPVGPIRLDFSYNLNPPIYPVIYNYSNLTAAPHMGQAGHFNFFFSLGQAF